MPGASGIRALGRITHVVNVGLLISGALFLDFILGCLPKPSARLLLVSCMTLALFENCLLLALLPLSTWRQLDPKKHFHFYNDFYGMYTYPRDWYARPGGRHGRSDARRERCLCLPRPGGSV